MKRILLAVAILVICALAAACTPPETGSPTATGEALTPNPTVSLTPPPAPSATATPKPSEKPTTTPTIGPSRTVAPTQDIAPTPTQEFCEAVTIEYVVIVPSLNVRSGRGTSFPVVGALQQGETFIGSLCIDPDTSRAYYWTQILEDGHRFQGAWAAYCALDFSICFLN